MLKRKKYLQKFRKAYTSEFPCIVPSRKGEHFAFCSVCRCDISIGHGGKKDLTVHMTSVKHHSSIKSEEHNATLNSFLVKEDNAVIRAECLFTAFILEHNLPLSVADHAGPLLRKMFPKCEDAQNYGCGRTKTAAIISEMAYNVQSSVVSFLQQGPFSIATDGSNDSDMKLYPIVVTYHNMDTQKIESSVLCVPELKGDATGKNIGNLMINSLRCLQVPVTNCLAFSADNANVMIGQKKGVASVLKQENNIFVMGCPCHLINLAAEKGTAALPVKIDEILVDVYYYLEKSCKRKESLETFQKLHDAETRKILKHTATRWLSLGKCISRLLEQWEPLLSFFLAEVKSHQENHGFLGTYKIPQKHSAMKASDHLVGQQQCSERSAKKRELECEHLPVKKKKLQETKGMEKQDAISREERLFLFLSSDLSRAYCLFLQHILPVFDRTNCILQSQVPHVHVLRKLLLDMLKELLTKFVKPTVMKRYDLPFEVVYHGVDNQKDDDSMVIGISSARVANTLCPDERKTFFLSLRKFFISSCDYIRHKFPLSHEVLINAEVAQLSSIESASFHALMYFVDLVPGILPFKDYESKEVVLDALQAQFCNLQVEELPPNILREDRIDIQWSMVGSMKGPDGQLKYNLVAKVMLTVLTIPHSNAECERIFSQVKKTRTQFRSSMAKKTLENILIVKSKQQENSKCHEQNYTSAFLKKAKSATYTALKQ